MNTEKKPAYKNATLSIRERVADLLPRMSLEQKIAQLNCLYANGGIAPSKEQLKDGIGQISAIFAGMTAEDNARCMDEIQRTLVEETELGIPALIHAEGLSGAVIAEATNFPVAIGLGATWDDEKINRMADVIRKQMRAVGINQAFSPVLDVARDLRWGRVGETYGESPALTSQLGVSYVKGLQGENLFDGVAATAKHFLGFAMGQGGLNLAAASITPRELREVYAKPFEAAIREAGLATVMNTYSAIDNEPVVASKKILTDLLRGELGFQGVTVTDYASLSRLKDVFRVAEDYTQAGIMAFNAGMDQELPAPVGYGQGFYEAVKDGRVEESYLNQVVERILTLKFKLGLFDHPYPDRAQISSVYHQSKDEELSYQLACESVVLLKNKNNILPLSRSCGKIAVIGPDADNLRNIFGGYTYAAFTEMCLEVAKNQMQEISMEGVNTNAMDQTTQAFSAIPPFEQLLPMMYPAAKTIRQALEEVVGKENVIYAQGCDVMGNDRAGFDDAVQAAQQSDIVVMVVGGKNGSGCNCSIGENIDSSDINLPGVQEELVKAIYETGKPVILLHMDARPLCSEWISSHIPAILEIWYPGQCGGKAVADILFGEKNPGGKLPFTSIRNSGQIPVFAEHRNGSGYNDRRGLDVEMDPDRDHLTEGYVNESAKPLYPFGYGLSYTSFALANMELSTKNITSDGEIEISCTVTNIGEYSGDEVVQLYISDRYASMIRPKKELAGFCRISLAPGESKKVMFRLCASQMAFLNADMKWMIEAGDIDIMIGTSSDEISLTDTFRIEDTKIIDSSERKFFAERRVI